jgi:hypothetical protein
MTPMPSDQLNENAITAQKEFIDPEVSDLWRQAADAIHEWSQDALRRLEEARRGYNGHVADRLEKVRHSRRSTS